MKHGCAVLAFIAALLVAFASPVAAAPGEARRGQLANGLSYFIDPAKSADGKIMFSLVVRVGSQQTLPEEQSVAHIVEHIVHASAHVADTKGNLRARIERFGGVWGNDSNAATAETHTSYFVKLPAADPGAIEAGLGILTDWIVPHPLSDEEIDRETKAVVEEIRRATTDGALDLTATQYHVWFPGHRHYDFRRDRVGAVSATPAGIRRLYADWYIPANMAVIISGDVDADAMLAEIETRLGTIPRGEPLPLALDAGRLPVEGGHYAPLASEGPSETRVEISYKYRPAASSHERAREIAIGLIAEKAAGPALGALAARYGAPTRGVGLQSRSVYRYQDLEMLSLGANVAPGAARAALLEVLRVAATLRRGGLPEAEILSARDALAASLAATPVDAAENFKARFIYGTADPSPQSVSEAALRLSPGEVNAQLAQWLDPARRDVFLFYPSAAAATVPADAGAFAALDLEAERAGPLRLARPDIRIPAFTPFIAPPIEPLAGATAREGFVRWTLPRSGATLLYRHIDSDRLTIAMRRPGGMARLADADGPIARLANEVVARSGLASLDGFELERFYAASGIALRPLVTSDREGLDASGPAGQWSTLLQLMRAQLLQPLCRAEAFDDIKREQLDVDNIEGDTREKSEFQALIAKTLGGSAYLEPERLRALDLDRVCRQFLAMSGDTAGMVIVAKGNLDTAEVYRGIASTLDLPAQANGWRARATVNVVPTRARRDVLRIGDSKTATVLLVMRWRPGTDERAGALVATIMNQRMSERLRGVEKGTYDAQTGFSPETATFTIGFDTAPEHVERMIAAAKDELVKLRRDGVSAGELASARVKADALSSSPADVAEAWILRGARPPLPPVSDLAVKKWIAANIDLSRLHEFVRLPQASDRTARAAVSGEP